MSASASACGRWHGNASLIERFSSSTRTAIFTKMLRMVAKVAPRQRDLFGAASRTAAVFKNPLAGKAVGADLTPLIDYSLELGVALTTTALATLGSSPAQLRSYTKAALVGTGGDLEHGAAMIHPRLGMAMRRTIKRGRVIIPGHAKVGPAGTSVDLLYGPLDQGWDLDAFDSTPVLIHDAPRPDEIVLWIGTPQARASTPGARDRTRERSMH